MEKRFSAENHGVKAGVDLSYCAVEVRRHDPDRFLCALFAPADRREDLFALCAFSLELARVREQVSEPMLGRIRLQWWRDAVEEIYSGIPRRHAVIQPLHAAVKRYGLDRALLDRMIDAREADMDGKPPRDLAALEGYADGTAGALAALSLAVLGVADEPAGRAARHVALAWALTGLLRAAAFHAHAKRQYLPQDLMQAHGASQAELFELRAHPALSDVARGVAQAARGHLAAARALRRGVKRAALPVLLPAVLARRYLKTLERGGYDPLSPAFIERQKFAAWRITAAAFLGRY